MREGEVKGQMLSSSAKRVQDALRTLGVDYQVKEFAQATRTSAEAAEAVGCEVGQIAKSLVFRGKRSGKPVLAVASGANRVDEKLLADLAGEPIERATPEFVREQTGFAIGGVSPVGLAHEVETYVDEDLLRYPEIWAAAGTPNAVFNLVPADLPRMTGGRVARIAKN